MNTRTSGAKLPLWAGIAATLAMGLFVIADSAFAGGPAPVGLGSAAPLAVLAVTPAVVNTRASIITDLSPAAAITNGAVAAWPLFLVMVAYVLVLAFMVAARWRPQEATG